MPAGIINTGTHPKLLWPGIRDIWGQIYNEHAKEYPDLFDQLETDQAYEEDVQVTPFGLATIKPEGRMGSYDSEVQGAITRYTPITYYLGYIVTYEERMNNKYMQVSERRVKANAYSINQTIENVASFLYNNAFVTTYYKSADGAALISASHSNPDGSSYSNALTPAADFAETSAEDLCTQIMGAQNARGGMINIMPRSLHIGRQEWFNANRVYKSVLSSGNANNAINVLKATNAFPEGIKMNHYFTSAHAWFIRTTCGNGMQMFWREHPTFDQDNDFDTKNAKAGTFMWFSVGNTDPLAIYGSNGP